VTQKSSGQLAAVGSNAFFSFQHRVKNESVMHLAGSRLRN